MFPGYEFHAHKHQKTLGDLGIQLRGVGQVLDNHASDERVSRPYSDSRLVQRYSTRRGIPGAP